MYSFQVESLLFEENLNWCISTAEDAPILLGCKQQFVNKINEIVNLELFKVEREEEMY